MAKLNTPIPLLKLNDGNSIPQIAFGTGTAWYKKDAEREIDRSLVDSTKLAISLGYNHLDGAEVYGNERELGLAIKESGVARDTLFVTTKVMHGIVDIEASFAASLKKLQLDYVDLYLIHEPFFAVSEDGKVDEAKLQSAWAALEKFKAEGKAKSIGVSNYLPEHLAATLKTAKTPPAINQIEFHPYLQREALVKFSKEHNIAISAYGPLTAVSKASPGPADELLAALAKKYGVSAGEISLRYAIDQDIVAITTSSKEQRLSDYLRATLFKLTPEEVRQLSEAGKQKHFRGFFAGKFAADDRS